MPVPGPASSGKFYETDRQEPSVTFIFCPDPSIKTSKDWEAVLDVKCRDVPCLMREGFYWDDTNLKKEEGYLSTVVIPDGRIIGGEWYGTRHYFLINKKLHPYWIGTIVVYAKSCEALAGFNLDQLSFKTLRLASAQSQSGKSIYSYQIGRPDLCYNAIYDYMPMRGWWPWPREESEQLEREADDEWTLWS